MQQMKRNLIKESVKLSVFFFHVCGILLIVKAWVLGSGCLGLNPGFSPYELCVSEQVI